MTEEMNKEQQAAETAEEAAAEENTPLEETPENEAEETDETVEEEEMDIEEETDEESNEEDDSKDDGESKEEKTEDSPGQNKIFGNKLKGKVKKQEEEIANLTDRLKRSMAEFENFRKRSEREKSQMYEIGAGDVISKILPVLDNFERGLGAVPEDRKEDPIITGMEMIYKQMQTALSDLGVTPIEAVGQSFDPNLHNAVMHEENEELGENIVAEEFQKGYKYRDTVIRHSMVKVAN